MIRWHLFDSIFISPRKMHSSKMDIKKSYNVHQKMKSIKEIRNQITTNKEEVKCQQHDQVALV